MKCLKALFFIVPFALTLTNCEKNSSLEITATGIVQEQGMTTYQYGTHVLQGEVMYALKSDVIILNNYVGKMVTLKGVKVEGYPVDGGPDYLRVIEVTELD